MTVCRFSTRIFLIITLTTLVLLALAFHFVHAETIATHATSTVASTTPTDTHIPAIHNAAEVEEKVREIFSDAPVMREIARCESKFRQYTDAGNPLRGGQGDAMIGVFQFHEGIHAAHAKSLGFDIYTLVGNIAYARYVYDRSGTDSWISSFNCWNDKKNSTVKDTNASTLQIDLSFGQTYEQVRILQKLLNHAGFVIAESGPGSPGNETMMFGNLTRAAVRKFQCAEKIACSGDEYTTGYGYVDDNTRERLQAHKSKVSKKENNDEELVASLHAQLAELLKIVAELQKLVAARRG